MGERALPLKRWAGETIACIASAPSLTAEDAALVGASGLKTIAVNNAWKVARFATAIYAGDFEWWREYGASIDIPAERWTCSQRAYGRYRGMNMHHAVGGYNSGLRAIQLAAHLGAARIILLGYDCQLTGGRLHYDGGHPEGMKNPDLLRIKTWRVQFIRLAGTLKRERIECINASRESALQCFPRMSLEEALCRTG